MSSNLDDYVKKWLELADRDLTAAVNEIHVRGKNFISEAACFHAQQAAEKYLKAYLVTRQVTFEKTHNIEYLLEQCIKEDIDFNTLQTGNLTFYAVENRYPDDFTKPSREDAKECIEIAKNVKKLVFKKLGI